MFHRSGFIIRRRPEAGQHLLEFAILLGLVTAAAVAMQLLGQRSLQTGVKMVSDVILEPPPAPEPPDPADPVSTVSVQRCDDPANPTAVVTATGTDLVLQVACSEVREVGDSAFRRITTTHEISRGASVNEDARLQVFEE